MLNVRRAVLAAATFLLLCFAWQGIGGGVSQLPHAQGAGKMLQSCMQLGFGVFGLLVVLARLRSLRAWRVALGGWLVTMTLAGGLAPVVWGGTSWWLGLIAGVAALGLGAGIAWLFAFGARGMPVRGEGPAPAGATQVNS